MREGYRMLYVPMKQEYLERLAAMAVRKRRETKDQAAVLLERAIDMACGPDIREIIQMADGRTNG